LNYSVLVFVEFFNFTKLKYACAAKFTKSPS